MYCMYVCMYICTVYIVFRFSCHVFSEYQELVNDASTRGFVCIPLADSQGLLLQLVRQVDTVLTAFKQPEYYKVQHYTARSYLHVITIVSATTTTTTTIPFSTTSVTVETLLPNATYIDLSFLHCLHLN